MMNSVNSDKNVKIGDNTSNFAVSSDGNATSDSSSESVWRNQQVKSEAVTTFVDSTNDVQIDKIPRQIDIPFEGVIKQGIVEFLKRPIQVYEFSWDVSGLTFNFDPFGAFYNNTSVARKMGNFWKFSTGGMKIRVVTNGTPYLYGRYFLGYWPYYTSDPFATTFAISSPTRISALPNFHMIDPSANTVVEFNIPEVKQYEQPTTVASLAWGAIVGCVSTATLASATPSGNTQYCDMSFYASCIDPKIEFNTYNNPYYATSQEFSGKISAPLKNVSDFSKTLSTIPVIGKYATAFGEATNLGANMASMFGFSKPPDTQPISQVKNVRIGNITNSDGLDTTTVLALSQGASTTIDPGVWGLGGMDEMAISSITQRYALCYSFAWADTNAIGDVLGYVNNGPFAGQAGSYPTAITNVSYVSGMFGFWRGGLTYKIVFPISKFHTGRIQIIYDPAGNSTFAHDPTNVTMNWIVDLAQQSEIELTIPYTDKWKMTSTGMMSSLMGVSDATGCTGRLSFHVINKLRAGVTATTIYPQVFIKGASDYEVFAPTMLSSRNATTVITFQASGATGTLPTNAGYSYYGTSGTVQDDDMAVVSNAIASERVLSLRELGKRYTVTGLYTPADPGTAGLYYFCIRDFPLQPGYSLNGTGTGAAQRLYNNVPMSFLTFFGPSFVGWRGGIRTKLIPFSGAFSDVIVTRAYKNLSDYMNGKPTWDVPGVAKVFGNFMSGAVHSGVIVPAQFAPATCTGTANAIEVTMPWVDQNMFQLVGDFCNQYGTGSGIVVHSVTLYNTNSPMPKYICMKAIADDFSFVFYKGPPILYQTTIA